MTGHQFVLAVLVAAVAFPSDAMEPRPRADMSIREMVSFRSKGFVYRAIEGESEIYAFIIIDKLRLGLTEGDETVLVASWRAKDMKGGSLFDDTFEGDDFRDLRWSGGMLRFTFWHHRQLLACNVSGVEAGAPSVSCLPARP
jgi:hypothetical protein